MEQVTWNRSHGTGHMEQVTWNRSNVTCHMSHVTCHMSHVTARYVMCVMCRAVVMSSKFTFVKLAPRRLVLYSSAPFRSHPWQVRRVTFCYNPYVIFYYYNPYVIFY